MPIVGSKDMTFATQRSQIHERIIRELSTSNVVDVRSLNAYCDAAVSASPVITVQYHQP